ncbi:thermonuclease family protein [Lederbergia wuyishanensis]|uniref:Micrococcal nuclease n=1 Tax=Lederbergia wuyishanensis TaxID=1347903 RepID=A0ABU0D5R4_9BACI|nr:thermonuclease family protein [Lederbergia wuyishanensis]MCJ8009834.1 thermonuclease family protein [Lederbergia wuyishanensis]MDQ0343691.1 micrococcal nuclease [Lederbergia wuyishanensis]
MSRFLSSFLIFVLIFTIAGCSQSTNNRVQVSLTKPIDGDTIAVMYNGSEQKVRFLLVDSPETAHPRLGEQPFGQEAKDFTSRLVEKGKKIELEFDIGPNQDKYGRLLAYVYVDGKMIQEELLKKGLARVAYIYPPNTRYVDQFDAIQKKAQKDGVGIWEIENYAQEDGFHPETMDSISKESESKDCLIKGNIGREKIYHTPESQWYEKTKAEVMFCTEDEAVKAGFRPPKQ